MQSRSKIPRSAPKAVRNTLLGAIVRPTLRCPGGTIENSPTLQRWEHDVSSLSPEGTAEFKDVLNPVQPSLRDFVQCGRQPNAKALGYSRDVLLGQEHCGAGVRARFPARSIGTGTTASPHSNAATFAFSFRISAFGLLSGFGLRPSDFPQFPS
jgi:hypothetical protein